MSNFGVLPIHAAGFAASTRLHPKLLKKWRRVNRFHGCRVTVTINTLTIAADVIVAVV